MIARRLQFIRPGEVAVADVSIGKPSTAEALVHALYCGISTGTERLAYRGELPEDLLLDESIKELRREAKYPFPYGYILIGEVVSTGDRNNSWMDGRKVLIFHPHQDWTVVSVDRLIFLPGDISPELCVLIPSCETALTFIHDSAPIMGERVCLYGLGIIGQITARMLSGFPLENITLVDPSPYRRDLASDIKATALTVSEIPGKSDYDLSLELSGNQAALQSCLEHALYDGRILAGSWYGSKNVCLELGSQFHRKRLRIISSQVSSIAPALRGRWDYKRRMHTAIKWLAANQYSSWITHKIKFEEAVDAYKIIDEPGGEYLQVILDMR